MQEKTIGLEDSGGLEKTQPFFPLFVSLGGKRAAVVGGGDTAYARVKTLLKFGAEVRIISPEISAELQGFVRENKIAWLSSEFVPQFLEGVDIAVAATNSRRVNHAVGKAAKRMRILVSVADSCEDSTFLFPAVAQNGNVVIGVVSNSNDYSMVRKVMQKIREMRGKSH